MEERLDSAHGGLVNPIAPKGIFGERVDITYYEQAHGETPMLTGRWFSTTKAEILKKIEERFIEYFGDEEETKTTCGNSINKYTDVYSPVEYWLYLNQSENKSIPLEKMFDIEGGEYKRRYDLEKRELAVKESVLQIYNQIIDMHLSMYNHTYKTFALTMNANIYQDQPEWEKRDQMSAHGYSKGRMYGKTNELLYRAGWLFKYYSGLLDYQDKKIECLEDKKKKVQDRVKNVEDEKPNGYGGYGTDQAGLEKVLSDTVKDNSAKLNRIINEDDKIRMVIDTSDEECGGRKTYDIEMPNAGNPDPGNALTSTQLDYESTRLDKKKEKHLNDQAEVNDVNIDNLSGSGLTGTRTGSDLAGTGNANNLTDSKSIGNSNDRNKSKLESEKRKNLIKKYLKKTKRKEISFLRNMA